MNRFAQYISEAKNVHMEHIEDSIFNEGSEGVNSAIAFLSSVTEMLSGNSKSGINVTVKWDGAPAVFAGINPENGKFFVATKSIFNVNPKLNYTKADIRKNHSGGLAAKLEVALSVLPKLGIVGILQGDVMFTQEDVQTQTIDGESMYTFQPNTILYAVPVNSDLGKQIKNAKLGIVFHTKYSGKTIKELSASFDPKVNRLAKTKDVWFTDADFRDTSGSATLTKAEYAKITELIRTAGSAGKRISRFVDELASKSEIISELKIYGNSLVRQGVSRGSAEGFITYYNSKMQTAIDSLKTDRAKERKESIKKSILGYLTKNSKKLDSVFALHFALASIKIHLVRKLEAVKQIGTFIKTDSGFRVTAPEGFVAVDRMSNKALKLVDRMEFSQQNFTATKNWDK
jgi:hypothetical protein|tara:strand:+ start:81 stop:1283 length:1203 start_codon:yes stop_codon:yes gene_type:complete